MDCDNAYAPIPGETSASFTATNLTGNYAVQIDDNGCIDTSACYLVDLTGLDHIEKSEISIYPNPNNGLFTIASSEPFEAIQIMDVKGRLIFTEEGLNLTSFDVNILNENTGVYYVRISGDFGVITKKVVLH